MATKTVSKTEETIAMPATKYISSIGRRKRASAQVRLYEGGSNKVVINGMPLEKYFPADNEQEIVLQSLKLTNQKTFDFSVLVKGGGKVGQAEAVRHGITRALVKFDPELKPALKAKDLMTRDAREKERKKPGLKKARRAPQWAKR